METGVSCGNVTLSSYAAQQVVAADNGFAVDGIQPTASVEIYFPDFRAPGPPLPLNSAVGFD
jgi:hypothetical protein